MPLRLAPTVAMIVALALLLSGGGTVRPGMATLRAEELHGHPPPPTPPDALPVVVLAGEGGMLGVGAERRALPADSRRPPPGIQVAMCQPALHEQFIVRTGPLGADPYKLSRHRFGPEWTFAQAWSAARPGQPLLLVKYATPAAALGGDFRPPLESQPLTRGGPAYQRLIYTAKYATAGTPTRWLGLIWFQGESDADDAAHAKAYEANLRRFVARVRRDLEAPFLPVLLIQTHAYDPARHFASHGGRRFAWAAHVRTAQQRVAATTDRVALLTWDGMPLAKDGVHPVAEAQLTLGQNLAHDFLRYDETGWPMARSLLAARIELPPARAAAARPAIQAAARDTQATLATLRRRFRAEVLGHPARLLVTIHEPRSARAGMLLRRVRVLEWRAEAMVVRGPDPRSATEEIQPATILDWAILHADGRIEGNRLHAALAEHAPDAPDTPDTSGAPDKPDAAPPPPSSGISRSQETAPPTASPPARPSAAGADSP